MKSYIIPNRFVYFFIKYCLRLAKNCITAWFILNKTEKYRLSQTFFIDPSITSHFKWFFFVVLKFISFLAHVFVGEFVVPMWSKTEDSTKNEFSSNLIAIIPGLTTNSVFM